MVKAYMPEGIKEAMKILNEEECIVFAGGTDLMVSRKAWSGMEPAFEKPVMFIDGITELKNITRQDEILTIGSGCTLTEIINSPEVSGIIKEVLLNMASPAIRNVATLGGNICNSSPAGDSLPLLYAMDAWLTFESMEGIRKVPVCEFITGPKQNALKKRELLTKISIPLRNFNVEVFRKVGTRKSSALSKVSFIGLGLTDGNVIEDIRLTFGATAPRVVRSRKAEEKIINMSKAGGVDLDAISEMYEELILPIDDQRSTSFYRKAVSIRLIRDFLTKLSGS